MGSVRVIQQGDLILKYRDALPANLKPVAPKNGRYILAEGEHTGHAHTIEATPYVKMFEDANGTLWLKINEPAIGDPVEHQEHHIQTLEPGIAEVYRVVEEDPFDLLWWTRYIAGWGD